MTNSPPALLEQTAKVLNLETILRVNKCPTVNRYGMAILDRWALNQPEELKALEARSLSYLLIRILEQQTLEQETLESPANQARMAGGLTSHEILTLREVNMSL